MKKQQKSMVFINQSSGYLMIDIINAFADKFDNRVLITGFLNPRNIQLDPEVDIKWIIKYNRSNTLKRIFTWVWGFLQILYLIKIKYRKSYLFIVSNPPLATLVPLFCKNEYSYLIYDLYPDTITELKLLNEKSIIIKFWQKANKKLYNNASWIYTLSQGMKKKVAYYTNNSRIKTIPIWTDNSFLKPLHKKNNPFVKQHGLEDKFVIMYSGNLGRTHDLEVVIHLAKHINDNNVYFIIIGEGEKKEKLRKMKDELNLNNLLFLPWQPTDKLPFSMAAADLSLVTLSKASSNLSLPSKTFNFLSIGIPLLCIAGKTSELVNIVSNYNVGKCFSSLDIEKMIDFIKKLKDHPDFYKQLSKNALETSKIFGPENAKKFTETDIT